MNPKRNVYPLIAAALGGCLLMLGLDLAIGQHGTPGRGRLELPYSSQPLRLLFHVDRTDGFRSTWPSDCRKIRGSDVDHIAPFISSASGDTLFVPIAPFEATSYLKIELTIRVIDRLGTWGQGCNAGSSGSETIKLVVRDVMGTEQELSSTLLARNKQALEGEFDEVNFVTTLHEVMFPSPSQASAGFEVLMLGHFEIGPKESCATCFGWDHQEIEILALSIWGS